MTLIDRPDNARMWVQDTRDEDVSRIQVDRDCEHQSEDRDEGEQEGREIHDGVKELGLSMVDGETSFLVQVHGIYTQGYDEPRVNPDRGYHLASVPS